MARITMVIFYGVAVATVVALILGIVAHVRIDDLRSDTAQARVPVQVPRFRAKGNMMKLADGTLCVESAGLPAGVSLQKSSATRVEGRFYMIRAADKKMGRAAEDAAALPVVGSCLAPIVAGVRWRKPYNVIVDPTNTDGISRALFVDHVWRSINEWEARAPTRIVAGQDTAGCVDGFDDDSPDGKNEIMFGYIEEENVIAMTVIWGVFSGPVDEREIVESDMIFNLNFQWGNTSSSQQGIRNIGTHEHGHAIGMTHTDTPGATMYPTAAAGETHKQDLLACEAKGLCEHYGSSGTCDKRPGNALAPFVDVGAGSRCGASAFPTGPNGASSSCAASSVLLLVAMMVAIGAVRSE